MSDDKFCKKTKFFRLPVSKELLTGTIPVSKELLTGSVPVNNFIQKNILRFFGHDPLSHSITNPLKKG